MSVINSVTIQKEKQKQRKDKKKKRMKANIIRLCHLLFVYRRTYNKRKKEKGSDQNSDIVCVIVNGEWLKLRK